MPLAYQIGAAYILDLILGDPRWLPHPVKGIGWLIVKLEPFLRRWVKNTRLAGVFLALFIIGLTGYASFVTCKYFGPLLSIFLIYTSLSIKDLKTQSMKVYAALKDDDLVLARKKLSYIVGRDTAGLSKEEAIRATVETVAEGTVDGIISPLFFAVLGGAPLVLAYKSASTLDSMVGYRNEKYKDFGWFSARVDDLLNFIPARLSALLLALASGLCGKNGWSALRIALRDGKNNPSPNSGIPEAAVAGALGVQLGGLSYYNSKPSLKPLIGDKIYSLELKHIRESIKISYICSAITVVLLITVTLLGGR